VLISAGHEMAMLLIGVKQELKKEGKNG